MANCQRIGDHYGRLFEMRCPCGWWYGVCTHHAHGDKNATGLAARAAFAHRQKCKQMKSRQPLIYSMFEAEALRLPRRPLYRCACGVTVEDRDRERHLRQLHGAKDGLLVNLMFKRRTA